MVIPKMNVSTLVNGYYNNSENKLFVKIEKCQFFPSKVEDLGFLIIKDGAYTPLNKNKLEGLSCPSTLNQLQKTLGLLNWFSDFIPNFAEIIKPLSDNLFNFNASIVEKVFSNCIKKLEIFPGDAFSFNEQYLLISDASEYTVSLFYTKFRWGKVTYYPLFNLVTIKIVQLFYIKVRNLN